MPEDDEVAEVGDATTKSELALLDSLPQPEKSDDDQIKLAGRTEWAEPSEGTFLGSGARMIATGASEFALTQVTKIVLNHHD